MPPKGKGKKTPKESASPPSYESDSERSQENDVVQVGETPGEEDDTRRMEVDEKIVDFFEERPFFYDQANSDYKNRQKRNTELAELARIIGKGHTADSIWKRFVSIRTDLGKLKKSTKQGKSGQGAKKLTQLQKWKLQRYAFLEAHMKPGLKERSLGRYLSVYCLRFCRLLLLTSQRVFKTRNSYFHTCISFQTTQQLGDSDVEEVEGGDNVGDVADEEPVPSTTTENTRSSSVEKTKKKSKPSSNGVVDVLQSLLDETRKEMQAADKRVERLCGEQQNQAGDERLSWGQWLVSACQAIPAENFRNFQRDTFEASMRYLPTIPLAGATRLPPPAPILHSNQRTSHQPVQHCVQQDQRQPYLSMLHDIGPSPPHVQPYRVLPLDSVPVSTLPVPVTTSVFGSSCTASTCMPSIIAQAYQSVNYPGVQKSPELFNLINVCLANSTPTVTTSNSIPASQMLELSSSTLQGGEKHVSTADEPSVKQ